MIDLEPKTCNLCGGRVIYTSNSVIYGKEYGSGKCYICTDCGAYVGTHKPRPKEALGILSNSDMRELKKKCHDLFDAKWMGMGSLKERRKARKNEYKALANAMGIEVSDCHFGYFDLAQLKKAHEILSGQDK